jgi:hypothetical protein
MNTIKNKLIKTFYYKRNNEKVPIISPNIKYGVKKGNIIRFLDIYIVIINILKKLLTL